MKFSVITSTIAAALVAGVVFAGGHLAYEQRQAAMKTVGGSMKVIGGMSQGAMPFDAAALAETLAAMQVAVETAQGAFPAEPDVSENSKALAAIWETRDDFDLRLQTLADTITVAAATPPADAAALGVLLGQLGGQCQACHQNYRQPTQ
ncbi:MAG: cytochrome c [Paracoccaceae bacterium]